MRKIYFSTFCMIAAVLVMGCLSRDSKTISLSPDLCLTSGRNIPNGDLPTPEDLAKDAYCAEYIIQKNAPNGVVTIFGSSRATEDMESYTNARQFAFLWTKELGTTYPVLTGGGPGIMEAGNRGAKEAGGKSLSFATYFGSGAEKQNQYITDGFMFASFSQREAECVDRAVAIVIAPGGVGTEWEIFETLSKIQTKKKDSCPVVLLGTRAIWKTLFDRLDHMNKIKTISPENVKILQIAETPEKAVEIIKMALQK